MVLIRPRRLRRSPVAGDVMGRASTAAHVPAEGACVCRELRKCGADQRAGQRVGGVVHPGVDPRVGDERSERMLRDGGRRRHSADAGRKGERGGGVPGGKRARAWHPHVARERYVAREPVGSSPAGERLWSEETRRPTVIVGLELPKGELDRRIVARTDEMIRRGVVEGNGRPRHWAAPSTW